VAQSSDARAARARFQDALGKLLPLRISLNALQARTRRVSTVLEEVLENEDDLRDMCLTLLHNNESAFEDEEDLTEEEEDAVELVETLIDVYDARLDGLLDRIEQLTSNIETTQGVLELTLDNERNRIARLELLLSMARATPRHHPPPICPAHPRSAQLSPRNTNRHPRRRRASRSGRAPPSPATSG
jgi:antitoxin component HigA of HigAB toxin-antitoxin module